MCFCLPLFVCLFDICVYYSKIVSITIGTSTLFYELLFCFFTRLQVGTIKTKTREGLLYTVENHGSSATSTSVSTSTSTTNDAHISLNKAQVSQHSSSSPPPPLSPLHTILTSCRNGCTCDCCCCCCCCCCRRRRRC